MAIKGFKQVVEKKGYRLDDKDRKIFEKEIKRGYFGFDVGDIIEFVIYDASDNQLPQESVDGKKVRYISYTDENIKKYFDKVPENKFNKKSNNAQEYFIDTEKLLKEAGYSNGVFKTQITLLNRRLGSEPRLFDKVWIHEISPSRTEVRVLPVVEDGTSIPNSDLQARYDTFVNCGTFTADVLIFFDEFVNQMDVSKIVTNMLMKKGTISEGKDYLKLIEQEFKLVNFEVYLTQVKKLFQEIIDNYRMNRYYNPFEPNFGQPTGDKFGVEFDIAKVFDEVCEMASNAAEYSLPKQDIRLNTFKTKTQQRTIDKVKNILLTVRSNDQYSSTRPAEISAQIRGCMDSGAKNYNPKATVPSQCVYDIRTEKFRSIKVCNDKNANNYGKDGNCSYPPKCNDRNATNYGSYGACVYPAPPPPPPPPPNPIKTNPPATTTYSISAALHEANPSPAIGRGIQQIRVTASPGGRAIGRKFGANNKNVFISSAPSWCRITVEKRNLGYSSASAILRVSVSRNDGAARSGTIRIGSNLPGSPSTSVTIKQAGAAVKQPDPTPPQPPAKKAFQTNGPQTINFGHGGHVSGQDIIRITTTDTWSFNVTGIPGIYYRPNSSSGRGNAVIMFEGCARNYQDNPNRGVLTITSGDGIQRKHYLYQESAPKSSGYGGQGATEFTGGTGGKFTA